MDPQDLAGLTPAALPLDLIGEPLSDERGVADEPVKNTQGRKWLITVNNPAEKGIDQKTIALRLRHITGLVYMCSAAETGEQGTPHIHAYAVFSSALRFSTLKKTFPPADLRRSIGTSSQNRDYIFKQGKHSESTGTHDTTSHYEWGELPDDTPGGKMATLFDDLESGATDYEILRAKPGYMFQIDKIAAARNIITQERNKNTFRQLSVHYVWGPTGSGKTRGIMDTHGYGGVYRVTDYTHPFDGYKGQAVIAFEEFDSSLRLNDMLNYLDGYPLDLPCRYSNKTAQYTTAYIVSNLPLTRQYTMQQRASPEVWAAFLRRLSTVVSYSGGVRTETPAIEAMWSDITHLPAGAV